MAYEMFGQEEIVDLANKTISKYAVRVNVIKKLVFSAAASEEILLDALYSLIRRDPTAAIPLLSKPHKLKSTRRTKVKKPSREPTKARAKKAPEKSAKKTAKKKPKRRKQQDLKVFVPFSFF